MQPKDEQNTRLPNEDYARCHTNSWRDGSSLARERGNGFAHLPCSRSFHSCTLAYKLCHSHDMGDTLFVSFFLILFLPFSSLTQATCDFTSTQHSHSRTSVQCLGNTQQATLGRIGTQKEEGLAKRMQVIPWLMITDL